MARLFLFLILSLFFLLPSAAVETVFGTCVSVADGDTATVKVSDRDKPIKVRFYGIDAPEKAQDWGRNSKEVLSNAILNKQVRLEILSTDRYGRSVCKVYLIDNDGGQLYINLYLVETGNAWYYEQYAKGDVDLGTAQRIAQEQLKGLWGTKSPVPPWEYRSAGKTTESHKDGTAESHKDGTAESHKAGTEWFWVSATGKIHNSTCQHFGQGKGALSKTPKGTNCKSCGGATK